MLLLSRLSGPLESGGWVKSQRIRPGSGARGL